MQHNFEVGTVLKDDGGIEWTVIPVSELRFATGVGIPVVRPNLFRSDLKVHVELPPQRVAEIVSVPEPEIAETTDGDFAYALAEVCANLGGAMSFFYEDQFGGQNHQTVADVETYESGGHKYIAGKNSTGQYRQFRTDRVLGDVEAWRDEA